MKMIGRKVEKIATAAKFERIRQCAHQSISVQLKMPVVVHLVVKLTFDQSWHY